jgi:hypothetical protein
MSACSPSDRIMQTLRTRVPGATDDMLELELFNTIDEFLRRTNAWKYQTSVDISTGDTDYALNVPNDAITIRVMKAEYNGVPVIATQSWVVQSSIGTLVPEQQFPDGDAMFSPFQTDITPPSQLFTYALYRPNYVTVTNPPSDEPLYPFILVVSLSLERGCLECACGDWSVPDWMFDTYFQDWEDGVLGRLFSMQSKPWSNTVLAQYHGKRFRNEMAFRKQEAARGFEYAVQTWRYPRAGWP